EYRHLPIGSDHRRRLTQDPLQILLVDGVEDPRAAALLDDPERRVGGVLDGRVETAAFRDVAEPLAIERVIPIAPRELDVLRIAAAAFLADEPRGLLHDFSAPRSLLQPFQHLLPSAFERPGGHQRRLEARRRSGIWILIDRGVDAARACLVDEPERLGAPAPVPL